MEIEQKDFSSKVDKLVKKYSWIATEKQLFGKSSTDYSFASCEAHKARYKLESLQTEQSGLKKRVNKKVMEMSEKAEDEYNDLMSTKNIIEVGPAMYKFLDNLGLILAARGIHLQNDKAKINKVIHELDEKKKQTLNVTWLKGFCVYIQCSVTWYNGPPEGATFFDGLEVRVEFGTVWKQSLSELSGGHLIVFTGL